MTLRNFFTLAGLMGVTILLLLFTVNIRADSQAGVKESLPSTLPDDPGTPGDHAWNGYEVLFCQDPACGRSWLTRDVTPDSNGLFHCPENWQQQPCGGELLTKSLGEKLVLPRDTVITKKQYFPEGDPETSVFCSVVFSGMARNSIHRPEICMVGQGNTIEKSVVIDVPLEGRDPLQVMVLHLKRTPAPGFTRTSYYAYWFVDRDKETPYHHERMLWMAMDRVFRNTMQRWAYIAVSGERSPDLNDTAHYEEIREVVGKLYPQISLVDPS